MWHYSSFKKYSSCESHEVLDINWLKRHNLTPNKDELPKKDTLHWKSSNGRKSSLGIITLNEKLILFYSFGDKSIKDEILLEWQAIEP